MTTSKDLLDGWVLAFVGGRTLIGKPRADIYALEPAYELQTGMVQQGQRLGLQYTCNPVCWLASVRTMPYDSQSVVLLSDLSDADRNVLAGAVSRCEEIVRQMRAAQSGLLVAPASELDRIERLDRR